MTALEPRVAIEVLSQLDRELGDVDPDTRAIVGLKPEAPGSVSLVDISLRENGILDVGGDVAGLIVVTAEQVSNGDDEVVGLTQLLCVLRDGTEIGLYRVAGDDTPRVWRSDLGPDVDPDDAATELRPRDVASNTARRAFGLPSLVEPVDVADVAARSWLLAIASAALQAFDTADGPTAVSPENLGSVADGSPLTVAGAQDGELPSWDDLHGAAVGGELDLGGHLTVDAEHAAWLDRDAFAQVLDQTLPSTEELLGSLGVTGDDDLLAWVIDRLSTLESQQPDFA